MNSSKEGQELIEKFMSGAACGMEPKPIKEREFWLSCERIAEKMGLSEITEEVVRKYLLDEHNESRIKMLRIKKLHPEYILDCMIRPGGILGKTEEKDQLFCFHGGVCICRISRHEAFFLYYDQIRKFFLASQP